MPDAAALPPSLAFLAPLFPAPATECAVLPFPRSAVREPYYLVTIDGETVEAADDAAVMALIEEAYDNFQPIDEIFQVRPRLGNMRVPVMQTFLDKLMDKAADWIGGESISSERFDWIWTHFGPVCANCYRVE